MKTQYFVLTDKINEGIVIMRNDEGDFRYNVGTGSWEETTMFWDYEGGFDSPFEGLYTEISAEEAKKRISAVKTSWKGLWSSTKSIISKLYRKLPSPIKGIMYEDYVMLLTEYATDERERIILALSGMPLASTNWKSILASNNFPEYMLEALELWHEGTKELYQEHNRWALKAVMIELKYLNCRKDVVNRQKLAARYILLKQGYSNTEAYAGVTL